MPTVQTSPTRLYGTAEVSFATDDNTEATSATNAVAAFNTAAGATVAHIGVATN